MRIAFMSDLHREFYPDGTRVISKETAAAMDAGTYVYVPFTPFGPDLSKIRGGCDLLVIAGDFDVGAAPASLRYAAEYLGVPVAYLPGNHEFYGGNFERVMSELHSELPAGGAHLLDRTEIVFGRDEDGVWRVVKREEVHADESVSQHVASGEAPAAAPVSSDARHLGTPAAASTKTNFVRLLGCILWTDFGLYGDDNRLRCKQLAGSLINDYSRITVGGPVDAERRLYRRLAPSDTHGFHIRDRNWLEGKLDEPFSGETVVVTHMAPSMGSVAERFKEDPLSAAFASNLDGLIERTQPALWIHGHTHDSFDYRIGRTRVMCNPHGYYGRELNPDFRDDLVVNVVGGPDVGVEGELDAGHDKARACPTRAKRDWTME